MMTTTRKRPSFVPVIAATSAGVLVLVKTLADSPALQPWSPWINLAGILSLPLTVAFVVVMRSWRRYTRGERLNGGVMLTLAAAGTYSYWKPMYDMFFGSWA